VKAEAWQLAVAMEVAVAVAVAVMYAVGSWQQPATSNQQLITEYLHPALRTRTPELAPATIA